MSRYIYIILSIMLCTTLNVSAQLERQSVEFHITATSGGKTITSLPLEYVVFGTVKRAENAKKLLEDAAKKDMYMTNTDDAGPAFKAVLAKYKFDFKKARENNTFTVRAMAGQAVLIFIDESDFLIVEITPDMKKYERTVNFGFSGKIDSNIAKDNKRKLDEIGEGHISNVDITGNFVRKDLEFEMGETDDDGLTISVPIYLRFEKGKVGSRSRIMVQPYAIDCQTEDTVDYVKPLIFEGDAYHMLQDRRMGFKYNKNETDVIAAGYVKDAVLCDTVAFRYATEIEYTKPDINKDYKFYIDISLEDFTHLYDKMEPKEGSCNKTKYFKFLDINSVHADLNLQDYSIKARENWQSVPRDLRLNFEVGKAILTKDSMNYVKLDTLINEMRNFRESIFAIHLYSYTSPDGSYATNEKLAKERGYEAERLVKRGLGNVDATWTITPSVLTWDNVADSLQNRKETEKADSVREIIKAAGNAAPDRMMQALPYYTSHIEPILKNMRSMRCIYTYERMHIMNSDEVIDYYYRNKPQLISGEKTLSEGDYYNLFCSVTDSAEIDTITTLAYKQVTSDKDWEKFKFSLYVANRMAILQIKRGNGKPETLAPFVDLTSHTSPIVRGGITKNIKEILLNQAVAYLQQENRDTATAILKTFFSDSTNPVVQNLNKFITYKKYFKKYFRNKLTPEQAQEFEKAQDFVLSSSIDNKAIMCTEGRKYMGLSNEECKELVMKMSNDNAKKWYLLGMLEADEEQKNPKSTGSNYVPLYLALFWKSFSIDPNLRLTYFAEGQVSNDLHKKYPYRKRDIPRYKELLTDYIESAKYENEEVSGNDALDNIEDLEEQEDTNLNDEIPDEEGN